MKISPSVRHVARRILRRRRIPFAGSASYWDERYRQASDSGSGSHGRLAKFKGEVVNSVIADLGASSVVDWGCGDGAQLAHFQVPTYIGVDVSPKAVQLCRQRYIHDDTKAFLTSEQARGLDLRADIGLSLDVIYHLVEEPVYQRYMEDLFSSSRLAVVIYASNGEYPEWDDVHIRHRLFAEWVEQQFPTWTLNSHIPNRYPFSPDDPRRTSFSDFYIYQPK